MRKRIVSLAVVLSVAAASSLFAQNFRRLGAILFSYEEAPAISSVASGVFDARINRDETEITYELSYADLEGTVTQAHIHLGQRSVNGGITVFLCSNLGNGPPGDPAMSTIASDDCRNDHGG